MSNYFFYFLVRFFINRPNLQKKNQDLDGYYFICSDKIYW